MKQNHSIKDIHCIEAARRQAFLSSPTKILIVDDSIVDVCLIRRQIEDLLDRRAVGFTEAPRLIDAFELLDAIDFHLILLDLNLLDIHGPATVAAMHAQVPNTPIIVYSGTDGPVLMEDTRLCGAIDYWVKGHLAPEQVKTTLQTRC